MNLDFKSRIKNQIFKKSKLNPSFKFKVKLINSSFLELCVWILFWFGLFLFVFVCFCLPCIGMLSLELLFTHYAVITILIPGWPEFSFFD